MIGTTTATLTQKLPHELFRMVFPSVKHSQEELAAGVGGQWITSQNRFVGLSFDHDRGIAICANEGKSNRIRAPKEVSFENVDKGGQREATLCDLAETEMSQNPQHHSIPFKLLCSEKF